MPLPPLSIKKEYLNYLLQRHASTVYQEGIPLPPLSIKKAYLNYLSRRHTPTLYQEGMPLPPLSIKKAYLNYLLWSHTSRVYQEGMPLLPLSIKKAYLNCLSGRHTSTVHPACRAKGCEYVYTILTLGLTTLYFCDWICREMKIVHMAWPIERYKSMTIRWGSGLGVSISDFND